MPLRISRGLAIAGVSAIIGAAPLLVAVGAGALGSALGCTVNEGGASPCLVAGVDIGDALNSLFTMGWFSILTLPFAAIGFLAGLLVAILDAMRRR